MLLFLTEISDPFLALDGAGDPLPLATLRFYRRGTVAPQPVYSDSGLMTPISQPITADSAGEFVPIHLDPDLTYRSVLKASDGRLIFDVDPYEIDESETGRNLFRGPKVQALVDGIPQAGATMTFYTTETSTKRDTFADALLDTPHPNPIMADAGGFFPPIYLDTSAGDYKVDPSWTDEIDPYPPPPPLTAWDVPIINLGGGAFGNTNIVNVSGLNHPTSGNWSNNSSDQFRLAFSSNETRDAFVTELTGRQLSVENAGAPVIYDVDDAVLSFSVINFPMAPDIWTVADVGETYRVQIEEV